MELKEQFNPCGVVANMMDCNIVELKFKLQSCYYVQCQTTFGKGMKPSYPPIYGVNGATTVLL